MLIVVYFCFTILRLTRKTVSLPHRQVMFFCRMGGFLAANIVSRALWPTPDLTGLLLFWGTIALGEWLALSYARQQHLPDVDRRGLPLY